MIAAREIVMSLPLTDDQIMLQELTRDFAANTVAPRAAERDSSESFPEEELATAAQIGLMGLAIPETYGGSAVDSVTTALVYEEIARASAAMSVILSVHNTLHSSAIAGWASGEVQERLLPKLASGACLGAYALTESGAGSDAGAISSRAVAHGDTYTITGQKMFISNAAHAGAYIVFAVTDPAERTSKRITAFVVERDTPGLEVSTKERKLGILASEICEVVLNEVEVSRANILGEQGGGFGIAMQLLDSGRIGIAAQALGIAEAALDASLAYSKQRKQFGQSISSFQAIQWKLADISTRIEAARLLVWQAARLKDSGKSFSRHASQAKLFASELAVWASNQAVQIHGGYGYLKDFGVERLYRDAKVTELYEGTSEIQRLVIARDLLKDGAR